MPQLNQKSPGKRVARNFMAVAAAMVLAGCRTVPATTPPQADGDAAITQQVMARKDKLVHWSSPELRPDKPILVLLHGATDDPTEMGDIFKQWRGRYNVLLYSYNYHQPVEKVASDLVAELRALEKEIELIQPRGGPVENVTVITFSYSAIVFRTAVILADDRQLFSNFSLVQLVPTAGGSHLARTMEFPVAAWLVSLASKPSAAENPYGPFARRIWDGEGNRKFYESIPAGRIQTLLLEHDSHSLAGVRNKKVHQRYENGLGPNVIVIPPSPGLTHEYLPSHPVALQYLGKILDSPRDLALSHKNAQSAPN